MFQIPINRFIRSFGKIVACTWLSSILKFKHSALSPFAFPDAQRAQRGASSCENLVGEAIANFLNGPLCLKPERAVLGHERDGFD